VFFALNAILPAMANPEDSPKIALKDGYVLSDDTYLHYVEGGSGQPIVLLHGNDGTLKDFTMSIFDQLASRYQTLAFDRPGHGESTMLPGAKLATPQRQAEILHGALVRLGVSRPILVAHSWSGSLALSYAVQYQDDLAGIVLLAGMAYDTGGSKFIYRLAQVPVIGVALGLVFKVTGKQWVRKQLEQAFIPDSAPRPYVEKFLSSTCRLPQLKAAARDEVTINPALRNISQNYSYINIPVVIVTGDHDMTVSPKEHSYPLHKAIPNSQLIEVPNAGHELCFTSPKEVMQAIEMAVELARSSAKYPKRLSVDRQQTVKLPADKASF
jgi:pimeloyl-ACP methyl ester carboxylesterase